MKLAKKADKFLAAFVVLTLVAMTGVGFSMLSKNTFAEGEEETGVYLTEGAKHVTFYDQENKLTVKTDAKTVGEAIARAEIVLNEGDTVEPGVETEITEDNFFVNIYRARPVVVEVGTTQKYLMSASHDKETILREAGVTIYDGDEIEQITNRNFLETGVAEVYHVTRNGGRTVTVEEEIAFASEEVKDATLEEGASEVRQVGETGLRRIVYNVQYINGVEATREQVSEEVLREPVTRVTAVGTKKTTSEVAAANTGAAVSVEGTCADWVRAAGVSEADLPYALELIYHESGCRWNAANGSGAYGIPQALPGSKMASAGADWATNPVTQIRWMAGYVSRYGGWAGAVEFWNAHRWY